MSDPGEPRPAPPLVDTRGTPVVEGAEVAFNLSGEVCRGRVKRIAPSLRYRSKTHPGYAGWTIHVELLHDIHRHTRKGNMSKVTSPRNLLVLMAGES